MTRRLVSAVLGMALIAIVSATAVLGGEVTGTGKSLHIDGGKWPTGLHARSVCAFSGQEDLQYTDGTITRGVPGHAQSWGQIPKDFRDFLTSIGSNPGIACNPTKGAPEP
jgi:hypothetical protein